MIKIRKPRFNPHTEKQTKYNKEGISLLSFSVWFLSQSLMSLRLALNLLCYRGWS